MFPGKVAIFVLYDLNEVLYLCLATDILFSVPSNWSCKTRKFVLAFRSGYLSVKAKRLFKVLVNSD